MKLVPWDIEDVVPGMAVREKGKKGWRSILDAHDQNVRLTSGNIDYGSLLAGYTRYPSGNPCGKWIEDNDGT